MGRKPIYDLESLNLGDSIELKGKAKKFSWQYLRNFNARNDDRQFKHVREGNKVFIKRVA